MDRDQLLIFAILAATIALFVWGRWRYDVVALAALAASAIAGLIPMNAVFAGFGHPAVVLVVIVLALTRAFVASGLVDRIASSLGRVADGAAMQTAVLTGFAAVLSMFINNVGALALLMPVAIKAARDGGFSPSRILMPLAFGSILGGMVTLIGTPPNIIVATFRREESFALFDFAPVGLCVLAGGLLYILLFGWRLLPRDRSGDDGKQRFDIADYVTELEVAADSALIGKSVAAAERELDEAGARILGFFRGEGPLIGGRRERLAEGDALLVEVDDADVLKSLAGTHGLALQSDLTVKTERLGDEETALVEAVVTPGARIAGRTPRELMLRRRIGANLIAVAREGQPMHRRLRDMRLRGGDVLLMQIDRATQGETLRYLGCLPLAERELSLKGGLNLLPVGAFAAAIALGATGVLSLPVALLTALLVVIVFGVVTPRDAYDAIDWPVIMLLGAMIPVGEALASTGATGTLAGAILSLAGDLPVWAILGVVLVVTMTLSDVMNNAATAVVMAPIALSIADRLALSADPFLMAVAVGASCAFLTPIGHQNNTLIMGPGGYRFSDYWRMGLLLEVLVVAIAVPVILLVWPVAA